MGYPIEGDCILKIYPERMKIGVAYLHCSIVGEPVWIYKCEDGHIEIVMTTDEDAEVLLREKPGEYMSESFFLGG